MRWVEQVLRESPGWSELDWDSDLAPACAFRLCEGKARQRNKMAERPARPESREDSLVPPPYLPSTFRAAAQRWSSEWVHPSSRCWVRPCSGPLRGSLGTPAALLLTWTESLLVFTARCHRGSSSWHWCSRWGVRCGAGSPHSSVGTFVATMSLPILNCHIWVWNQPVLRLCPSCQPPHGFFFLSLVIRVLFS